MAKAKSDKWFRIGVCIKPENKAKFTSELKELGYDSLGSLVNNGIIKGKFTSGVKAKNPKFTSELLTEKELESLIKLQGQRLKSRHITQSNALKKIINEFTSEAQLESVYA